MKEGWSLQPDLNADLKIPVLSGLPFHHRDLFDRIHTAPAIGRECMIMARDSRFREHPIQIV